MVCFEAFELHFMLSVDLICWLLFRKISLSDNPLPKVVEQWKRRFTSILSIQLRDPKDAVSKETSNVHAIGWCSWRWTPVDHWQLNEEERLPFAGKWSRCRLNGCRLKHLNASRFNIFLQCCDFAFFTSTHNQIKHTHIFIRICASFAVSGARLFCTLHLIMFRCGTKALIIKIPALYSQSGFCAFWWGN